MKIALMHFRVYETDGVSLEMDKWRLSLTKLGHEVVYISGSAPKSNDIYLDELDYRSHYNNVIHKNAFVSCEDFMDKDELLSYIEDYANLIETKLKDIITKHGIDCIVPNNVSSLGFNLPVGIAIKRLAEQQFVDIVYHHHDFHWERERYSTPLFPEVDDYLTSCFPYPKHANHCTINHIAQGELLKRTGADATVVPNVFDFAQESWQVDDYNQDLRKKYNIKAHDIVFLQATRIVERKAIELGYRVVDQVSKTIKQQIGQKLYNGHTIKEDTKVHFVLAGLNELTNDIFQHLDDLLHSGTVEIHYINDCVDHNRRFNGQKIYSLWDVYTMCDFITYPSMLEGWGNQLLEGLFAKKPMLVYEYPVFKTDIKQFGLDLITIDSVPERDPETKLYSVEDALTKDKAEEVLSLLMDKEKYVNVVEKNFIIGKENLSYQNLDKILKKVFDL